MCLDSVEQTEVNGNVGGGCLLSTELHFVLVPRNSRERTAVIGTWHVVQYRRLA